MTGHDYNNGGYDKAILAVGSFESHGAHLPLGTDTLISYRLAKKVAERVKGLFVLPPVTVGYSEHYAHFPLTLTLRAETMVGVLIDVLRSVIKHGIRRIFILNGHDGNIAPIDLATRAVKTEFPGVKLVSLDAWWVSAGRLLPRGTFEVWDGLGHGGEGETSLALALFRELVQMEHARGVVPRLPANVDVKWDFAELTDCGATGDPTKATFEKGQLIEKVLLEALVSFFEDMEVRDWDYRSERSAR
ncbi:MAG: creatininase family protein [Bacillota bacterium]|nr:creatininase family protein [Bacillota bacterium]